MNGNGGGLRETHDLLSEKPLQHQFNQPYSHHRIICRKILQKLGEDKTGRPKKKGLFDQKMDRKRKKKEREDNQTDKQKT